MSKFNFFNRVSVTSTVFEDHKRSWDFNSAGIMILNESTTSGDIVQYSFDGVTVHGDTVPGTVAAGLAFDNRIESAIFFRLASAGSAVSIRVEAWGL